MSVCGPPPREAVQRLAAALVGRRNVTIPSGENVFCMRVDPRFYGACCCLSVVLAATPGTRAPSRAPRRITRGPLPRKTIDSMEMSARGEKLSAWAAEVGRRRSADSELTFEASSSMLRDLVTRGLVMMTDLRDDPEWFFEAHRIVAAHGDDLGSGFWTRFTGQFNLFAGTVLAAGGCRCKPPQARFGLPDGGDAQLPSRLGIKRWTLLPLHFVPLNLRWDTLLRDDILLHSPCGETCGKTPPQGLTLALQRRVELVRAALRRGHQVDVRLRRAPSNALITVTGRLRHRPSRANVQQHAARPDDYDVSVRHCPVCPTPASCPRRPARARPEQSSDCC